MEGTAFDSGQDNQTDGVLRYFRKCAACNEWIRDCECAAPPSEFRLPIPSPVPSPDSSGSSGLLAVPEEQIDTALNADLERLSSM